MLSESITKEDDVIMKKNAFILFFILLFFSFSTIVLADTPERQGVVSDYTSLFSDEEMDNLINLLSDEEYDFHILAIDNLDGENINSFSDDVFEDWDLSERDVLIVISEGDRKISLRTGSDTSLDKAILSSGGYKAFIDTHFIPFAKKGDFTGGVLNLTNKISSLDATSVESSPVTTPSSDKKEEVIPPSVQVDDSDEEESSFFSILIAIVSFFFTVLALYLGSMVWIKRKRTVQMQEDMAKQFDELIISIHRTNEKLRPYLTFTNGTTGKSVQQLNDSIEKLLIDSVQLQKKFQSISLPLIHLERATKEINGFPSLLMKMEQERSVCDLAIEDIVAIEKELKKAIDMSKEELSQVKNRFTELTTTLSFPLEEIQEKIAPISSLIEKADDLEEFDPIEAKKELGKAVLKLNEIRSNLSSIETHTSVFQNLPNVTEKRKNQIEELVKQEGLLLTEESPYRFFDEINKQNELLGSYLRIGNTEKSSVCLDVIMKALDEALQMTNNIIQTRNQNVADILRVEKEISEFTPELDRKFQDELLLLQSNFSDVHWKELTISYESSKKLVDWVVETLPTVKVLNDTDVQEYKKARKQLDELLNHVTKMNLLKTECFSKYKELQQKYDLLLQMKNAKQNEFQKILSTIRHHSLPNRDSFKLHDSNVGKMILDLERLINTKPYDLIKTDSSLKQLGEYISALNSEVNHVVQEKQDAERRLREAQSRYSSAQSRYGTRIRSNYGTNYTSHSNDVERLIQEGEYTRAISTVVMLESISREMETEYNHIIAQEEAERRRRQQEEDDRRREAERRREQERREEESRRSSDYGQSSGGSNDWSSGNNDSNGGSSDW